MCIESQLLAVITRGLNKYIVVVTGLLYFLEWIRTLLFLPPPAILQQTWLFAKVYIFCNIKKSFSLSIFVCY